MLRKLRKLIDILAFALCISAFVANPANAHGSLVSMTPASDSVLTSAPTQVVLTFDEKISPSGVGLTVTAPDGVRVDVGTPVAAANELSVKLGPIMLNGHYLVNYRVVSVDGHPVEASTGFVIQLATLPTTNTPKIDVDSGSTAGIEKNEGRSESDSKFENLYYFFVAALIGGLYIYALKRNKRRNNATN